MAAHGVPVWKEVVEPDRMVRVGACETMTCETGRDVFEVGSTRGSDPDLACLLFARDDEAAERQRVLLQEHGIFAHLGQAPQAGRASAGLGVPLVVSPDDQDRANQILASVQATGEEPWEDDLDDDDDFDDDEDDDDDFIPDDVEDDDDFDDDLDDDL